MSKLVSAASLLLATVLGISPASAAVLYSNGFETDITGWQTPTRVGSGTGGITSSGGSFHALAELDDLTRWGGYNYGAGNGVPTVFQEYQTFVDIYLDVGKSWANDTRFDFSSAINNAGGTHLSDFIFNAGFYNDGTGPGAGTSRFVISASTNSQRGSAFAKNPDKDPIAISTTGWYTFEHRFYDNGGMLSVDMSILNASDHSLVNQWTRDTSFSVATVGGNRYGWFDLNEFGSLAIDNSSLVTADASAVPEPATLTIWSLGALGMAVAARRKRKQA